MMLPLWASPIAGEEARVKKERLTDEGIINREDNSKYSRQRRWLLTDNRG